jgi:type I restriction enzyme S subunit
LGEIPAHWEVKRLKFLTSLVTSGSRGWAQYYSDDGAIFLRIGNLSRTSIELDFQDIQYVSPPRGTEGERTQVQQNDVLLSITAYIGSVAVVTEDIGEAYVNQHIALTRPRKEVINSRWLAYCLMSQIGQAQFGLLLYGGTKDGLGLGDVSNLYAFVTPLAEQIAVVEFINRETAKIDALIAKIREGIEKLKEYRTALISAAVTGKIDVRNEVAL